MNRWVEQWAEMAHDAWYPDGEWGPEFYVFCYRIHRELLLRPFPIYIPRWFRWFL